MRRFGVIVVLVGMLALGPSAQAAWGPSRVVAPGTDPLLGIGRSGVAAIVTTTFTTRSGPVGVVRLSVMPSQGRFRPAHRLSAVN